MTYRRTTNGQRKHDEWERKQTKPRRLPAENREMWESGRLKGRFKHGGWRRGDPVLNAQPNDLPTVHDEDNEGRIRPT